MKLLRRAENSNSLNSNSLLIFLIRFFPSFANVLVVIIFSRTLSQQQYGEYQNFWVQLLLLSSVATIGIPAFILTYSSGYIKLLLQQFKWQHYLSITGWILIISFAFAWLRNMETGMPLYISALFFFTYAANAIAESILIVTRRFRFSLYVNLIYTLVFLCLHNMLLAGQVDTAQLFFYLAMVGAAKLIVSGIYTARVLNASGTTDADNKDIKEVRILWMHIGLYDVLQRVFTWIDKFIVSLVFTAAVSAVYFNATYDIPFLPLLLGAVGGAALMQMAGGSKGNDEIATISLHSARILSAVVFPLFFFLFVYRQELFTEILSKKYAESVPIFTITVFIIPLRAYNFTAILQNKHKGSIINLGALLDMVIALALMYPLFQLMGLAGLALSFVISSYLQGGFYLWQIAKVLNTSIFRLLPVSNWLMKVILFCVIFVSIHYISRMFFSSTIVLILGSVAMAATVLVTLAIEFQATRKLYGSTIQEK